MPIVPRRILIVRPSALGDVCRSVPLLWSLRSAFPLAVIDWVVEDVWSAAVSEHPALSRVVPFPKRAFRAAWRSPAVALRAVRWFRSLRRAEYDMVVDAQGLARSGLMSLATGARIRISSRAGREFSWIAANRRVSCASEMHVVDAMLQLVGAVGASTIADMRLVAPSSATKWWADERTRCGIGTSYAIFATANGWEGKRWIADRWRALLSNIAQELAQRGIRDVVWIGGPGEEQQVRTNIGDGPQPEMLVSHNLAGQTTVGQTMAIVQSASLVVALDSAPAHLAVGFGVPLIALYGATQPATDGPYHSERWCVHGGRGERLARHAYRDARRGGAMMERISVDEVAELVRARLRTRGSQ